MYELNKEFKQIEKRPIPLLSKEGGMSYKYFYTKYDVEIDLHKHYVDEILLKNPKT
ncbi:MAG: hypothetical protein LBD88_00830 [Candidatus Peribacteria bacterium]|nr:hypothetical protein [Candidatus Peribacteria bacterium]